MIGALLVWGVLLAVIFWIAWAVGEAKEQNRAKLAVDREERRANERARRKASRS